MRFAVVVADRPGVAAPETDSSTPAWWVYQPDPKHQLDIVLEVYRQGAENARTYANSRFSNLSAFLTYVSLLTAGIAVLISSVGDGTTARLVYGACLVLSVMGLLISGFFFELEFRHHHWWKHYERDVVRRIEKQMLYAQDPASHLSAKDRKLSDTVYRRYDPRRYASATRATYSIYAASLLFFSLAILFSLVMLAGSA
jgi:hypothetical protein